MVGINSSGQRIEMNWEEGPSPMQLALQMVGACSIVDVVVGLKERNFTKAWVDMKATRNDESPRYFTSMHMAVVRQTTALRSSVTRQFQARLI